LLTKWDGEKEKYSYISSLQNEKSK
jgi:hypothetical protein